MIYDGLCGYTDDELDELAKKAKALGIKVNDRRKWWNRFCKKQEPVSGLWFNVKTRQAERK